MLGCKNSHFSHNVPTDFFFCTRQVCFRKKYLWCHQQDPKGKRLRVGVNGVCMKLSHGWLQMGTVSAEHMAGTQLVTAGASKTSVMSMNFLELAQYTCFCRIQVMNLALFLPPSSLNSRARSQQDASPLQAFLALPGYSLIRLCGDRVEWQLSLLHRNPQQGSNSTATWQSEKYTVGKGPSACSSSLWSLKCWSKVAACWSVSWVGFVTTGEIWSYCGWRWKLERSVQCRAW